MIANRKVASLPSRMHDQGMDGVYLPTFMWRERGRELFWEAVAQQVPQVFTHLQENIAPLYRSFPKSEFSVPLGQLMDPPRTVMEQMDAAQNLAYLMHPEHPTFETADGNRYPAWMSEVRQVSKRN
ncbi:MAG TPA: hypothetical protein VM120_18875, partial [Bryobacteraceae bacterium]|nr:hypothetical protein [Bryobacteraceae bacterium]